MPKYWRGGRDPLPKLVQWIADGLIDTISGDDVPFIARLVQRAGKAGRIAHGRWNRTELDHRLRVAEAVVREAGRVAADHFARRELLSIHRKGAQDLVSEADRACEDLIVGGLAQALSATTVSLGEERGSRNLDADALWIIDPIDGTHNFLTGIPFWCVSVGLVVAGELVLGIIYHPLAAELYSARKRRRRIPERASDQGERRDGYQARSHRDRLQLSQAGRRPCTRDRRHCFPAAANISGSAPARSALPITAAGRFDGYWERHINSWDAAAGLVLVREAGGYGERLPGARRPHKGQRTPRGDPEFVEPLHSVDRIRSRA